MQSLEARKADRAYRREHPFNTDEHDALPLPYEDNTSDEGATNTFVSDFNPETASFSELKAYLEEREQTVNPGTSTDQLRERAKALQAQSTSSEAQGNGAGATPPVTTPASGWGA